VLQSRSTFPSVGGSAALRGATAFPGGIDVTANFMVGGV
jgi:hypothetical protein